MLNDESEKDTEILKKQISSEFKVLVKTTSKDHMEKIKTELIKGFKGYYDELNQKIIEELQHQEAQQKDIHDKIDNYEQAVIKLKQTMAKKNQCKLACLEYLTQTRHKAFAFRGLKMNFLFQQCFKAKISKIQKILHLNQLRNVFFNLKRLSFLEKTQEYEARIKNKTEDDILKLEERLKRQNDEMWALIAKAEEKLKHENRKKVQVKLQLDQMVLRGISALNLQALSLSQNSLKDVVKCDYDKEIDKKYSKMMFPETHENIKTKTLRSNTTGLFKK